MLGDFIRDFEKIDKTALFVITGDHFSHIGSASGDSSLLESVSVPLILYRKGIKKELRVPKNAAGGHIDIGRTLVELIAHKGFQYHTMGQDLLFPKRSFIGLEIRGAITDNLVIKEDEFEKISNVKKTKSLYSQINKIEEFHSAAKAIAWWRLVHGNKLSVTRNVVD